MLWVLIRSTYQGASNEYKQHMFSCKNKKNIYLITLLTLRYGFYEPAYLSSHLLLIKKNYWIKSYLKTNVIHVKWYIFSGCGYVSKFITHVIT